MSNKINRREFIQLTAAGSALCLGGISAFGANPKGTRLISPGCRGTKVKVARIYMGTSGGLWPKPKLDFRKEIQFYESEFAKLKDELSDVEFIDKLITSAEQVGPFVAAIQSFHPGARLLSWLIGYVLICLASVPLIKKVLAKQSNFANALLLVAYVAVGFLFALILVAFQINWATTIMLVLALIVSYAVITLLASKLEELRVHDSLT